MRLVSFVDAAGDARLGAQVDGQVIDLTSAAPELPVDCGALLAVRDGLERAATAIGAAGVAHDLANVAVRAPLQAPGKIICLGMNYRSHLEEVGADEPTDPTVFAKYASSIVGPDEAIVLPAVAADRVDYEAELALVVGRRAKDVPASEATDAIAGYTVANDVSARDWQLRRSGGQWLLGKTFDTFLPLGPALVTADELADPSNLQVRCTVSGELLQDGNTSEMLFTIPEIIAYMSTVVTLEPGDLILTGTPGGVGMARTPRRFLRAGDVVEVDVQGIGTLRNPVTAAA